MSCCGKGATNATNPKKSISDRSNSELVKRIVPVNNAEDLKIEYSLTVKTGDLKNSATNGPVYVNIFGRDNKQTKEILVPADEKTFSDGSIRKFQLTGFDVGKPQRVVVRHGDEKNGWFLDYIEISVHKFLVRFVANRWLNLTKNDRKLEAELFGSEQPAVNFNVELKVGNEQEENFDSPIYVQIFGDRTTTSKVFLDLKSSSLSRNSTLKSSFSNNNVGKIERIRIGFEPLGKAPKFFVESIRIETLGQEEIFFPTKNLAEKNLFLDLETSKNLSKYEISIKTSNFPQGKTSENVEMIVRGSEGQIKKFSLKNFRRENGKVLFERAAEDFFQIKNKNIGKVSIENLTIGFSAGSGQIFSWTFDSIRIVCENQKANFSSRFVLSNRLGPNFSWLTLKPETNGDDDDDVDYQIRIETGKSTGNNNLVLAIFGEENNTPQLLLNKDKFGKEIHFDKDSTIEFWIRAVDVGKVKKVNIGHEGKSTDAEWFLETIELKKNDEVFRFEVHRWLSDEKDDRETFVDLFPEKEKIEHRIVFSGAPTDDRNVFVTIFGENEQSQKFRIGAKNEEFSSIWLRELGKLEKIRVERDENDGEQEFSFDSIRIEKNQEKFLFSNREILNANNSSIELLPDEEKRPSSRKSAVRSATPKVRIQSAEVKSRSSTPKSSSQTAQQTESDEKREPTPERKVSSAATRSSVSDKKISSPQRTPSDFDKENSHRNGQTPRKRKETTYHLSIRTSHIQEEELSNHESFYVQLEGEKGSTEKLFLVDGKGQINLNKSETSEIDFRLNDLGKLRKLVIGQEQNSEKNVWHVEHVVVKHAENVVTFNVERSVKENSSIELFPSFIPKKTEFHYKIILHTGLKQQQAEQSSLLITIFGSNGVLERIPLDDSTAVKKTYKVMRGESADFETRSFDIGKIWKIVLSQDKDKENLHWHIDHVIIKASGANTNFYADEKLEANGELELFPSSLPAKSARSTRRSRNAELSSRPSARAKETDYKIIVITGEKGLEEGVVTVHLHGDFRVVPITLKDSTTNEKPFQSNSTDEFECRATEVDRIRRIHVEHSGTDRPQLWDLKSVIVRTGRQTITFHGEMRLDEKKYKVTLYPMVFTTAQEKQDFVQTQLRELREHLRAESSKIRPPSKKNHKPYVYNDLAPYFDTTSVDRAIHSELDLEPAYYTRLTALRIVEPWESYGMDFGVNYQVLKHSRGRSFCNSAKRPTQKLLDESIDRKQGSTHLPKFPCVGMKKPREYVRVLTVNDIPRIRSYVRDSCTAQAKQQIQRDYERTRDDFYRMQLDDMESYRESNRDNMRGVYHAYLQNNPGSRKALRDLCD